MSEDFLKKFFKVEILIKVPFLLWMIYEVGSYVDPGQIQIPVH